MNFWGLDLAKPQWKMVLLIAAGLLISYADRSNMAVAIIPMSKELNWDLEDQGRVLSGFFYGYLFTQILGGVLADKYGGKRVLGIGSLLWTGFTLLTPTLSRLGIQGALLCRFLLGLGEGVGFPAAHSLISRWVPKNERSVAVSIVTSFAYSGSPLAALISAPLGETAESWPNIFYLFGAIGLTWTIIWAIFGRDGPLRNQAGGEEYRELDDNDHGAPVANPTTITEVFYEVPWREIFSAKEVWAIFVNQFCSGWGFAVLINWLPTYFNSKYNIDVTDLGVLSALPYTAQGITGLGSGFLADYLIVTKKWNIGLVRRYLQIVGMVGPGVMLIATDYFAVGPISASLLLTATMGTQGFTLGALSVSQHDIAPAYSGILFGLGNIFATFAGAIGVWLTGVILQGTWGWAGVFGLASLLRFIGAANWWFWGGGDRIVIH